MSSKRIKISFTTINNNVEYTIIDKKAIAETNARMKKAMKIVVRRYKKNETLSQRKAAALVLNA